MLRIVNPGAAPDRGWTRGEQNQIYRTHYIMCQLHGDLELEWGTTDHGYPWATFVDPSDNSDVTHFMRGPDGVAVEFAQLGLSYFGRTLAEALHKISADESVVLKEADAKTTLTQHFKRFDKSVLGVLIGALLVPWDALIAKARRLQQSEKGQPAASNANAAANTANQTSSDKSVSDFITTLVQTGAAIIASYSVAFAETRKLASAETAHDDSPSSEDVAEAEKAADHPGHPPQSTPETGTAPAKVAEHGRAPIDSSRHVDHTRTDLVDSGAANVPDQQSSESDGSKDHVEGENGSDTTTQESTSSSETSETKASFIGIAPDQDLVSLSADDLENYYANTPIAGYDVQQGDNGDDVIQGTNTDEILMGLDGNDVLLGGDGDDVLLGGKGHDTLEGDDGDDLLLGGRGNDDLDGGDGDDLLFGQAGHDVIEGGNGNDTALGGRGDDTLDGGEGDDILHGQSGDDVIRGGRGDDVATGGEGDDVLAGNEGDDFLDGGEGHDTIRGQKGNDLLIGDKGHDIIYGGAGDDIIHDNMGGDTIDGGEGSDTIFLTDYVGETWISNTIMDSGTTGYDKVILVQTMFNSFEVQGTFNAQTSGVEEIDGSSLTGEHISTHADGANFDFTDILLKGIDKIVGREGNHEDKIIGSRQDDTIIGFRGNDRLWGGSGDDRLYGNEHTDELHGGIGTDILYGGVGSDILFGGKGNDTLVGGEGDGSIAEDAFDVDIAVFEGRKADFVVLHRGGDEYSVMNTNTGEIDIVRQIEKIAFVKDGTVIPDMTETVDIETVADEAQA